MPSDLYIDAAKAGAPVIDLVRMTRRVSEDIYRNRVDWEAAVSSTNIELERYLNQAVLAGAQIKSEGHEGGSGNTWRHVIEFNARDQVIGAITLMIAMPVLEPGLVGEVQIRCKNQGGGELLCAIFPGLDDKIMNDSAALQTAEQYQMSKPVQAAEGWVTFDFSKFGIIKEAGTMLGILLQPAAVDGNHANILLWESVNGTNNKLYVGMGMYPDKWIARSPDYCIEFRMATQGYQPTGSLTVHFDLGATPGALDTGEWQLCSWIESGANLTATAWGSATGAFGGEETALGVISDGAAISQKFRYYKIIFAMAASSDKISGCGVIEAGPRFIRQEIYVAYKRAIWGYPPVVGEISITEGEVNPEEGKSSAAQSYLKFTDEDISRRLQEYDYQGELIEILRGYDYPEFALDDCEVRATARIIDYKQDEKVEIETLDLLSDLMARNLPTESEIEDQKNIVNILNLHPADAVVLLLRRAGLRPSLIDTDSISEVKAVERIVDVKVTRILSEKKSLKDILDELLSPILCSVYERNGKVALSRLDWEAASVAAIIETDILIGAEKFIPRLREGRGYHVLKYGAQLIDGELQYPIEHQSAKINFDAYQRFSGRGMIIEYPWLPATRKGDADVITEDLTYIRAHGLPVIETKVDTAYAWLLPGMTVEYYASSYRRRGVTETNPILCHVARVAPQKDAVELALVVIKDAQSVTPGGGSALGPPVGFTALEINGGARFTITASEDTDVEKYLVYESLAGAEKWSLTETWLPSQFSGGTKVWDVTSYSWLGIYDRKVLTVAGHRLSEPLYIRNVKIKWGKLAAPGCTLFRFGTQVYYIRLDSKPAGLVEARIEHREYGKAWEPIPRNGNLTEAQVLMGWIIPSDRKAKAGCGPMDFFRVAGIDKFNQVGNYTSELFIAQGPQLGSLGLDPPNAPVIESPAEMVHQPNGNYYRTEIHLTVDLPAGQADLITEVEIQREDDGGLGGEFTSGWEALDRKSLIHDENTPQPMQFEYVDWRQIKAGWQYGWRMRVKGNNGLYSAWSDTITATVIEDITAPDVPTIVVTPLDLKFLIIMSAPTQGGNVCRSFSHFQVQGYEQSAGVWVDVDAHAKAIIVYQGLTPANLGQTWKHRVRAWNTSQRYSAWSTETGYQQVIKIGTSSLNTAVNTVLSQVSTNTGNISTHATLISQNADAIVLRALSTSLDTTNGRVTTCESNISVNASNILLRVSKNDVINQINISTEETTISGSRLHVTSSTTFDSDVEIQGILKSTGGIKTKSGSSYLGMGYFGGYGDALVGIVSNIVHMRLDDNDLTFFNNTTTLVSLTNIGDGYGALRLYSYAGEGAVYMELTNGTLSFYNKQVVGQQRPAIVDATDPATTMARLNDLLFACRCHGLIAA